MLKIKQMHWRKSGKKGKIGQKILCGGKLNNTELWVSGLVGTEQMVRITKNMNISASWQSFMISSLFLWILEIILQLADTLLSCSLVPCSNHKIIIDCLSFIKRMGRLRLWTWWIHFHAETSCEVYEHETWTNLCFEANSVCTWVSSHNFKEKSFTEDHNNNYS